MSRSDRKSKRKPHTAMDEIIGETIAAPMSLPDAHPLEPLPPSDIIIRDLPGELSHPETAEWPFREWPVSLAPRATGFQVVIRRSVLNEINRHGQTTSDVEVCGVLAGNVYRDDAGSYLQIDAAVRGDHAGNSTAQVTFTAETWNHIQGVMEKDHPQLRMVGWYHTHPGFGIFLSDMDLFIHGNFFNLPWQIALVYDPISGEEGVFIWRDSKTVRVPFVVEEDVEKEIVTVPVSAEITAAALADFSRRMQKAEKRQRTIWVSMAFLAMIALGWPFVLFTILSENHRPTRASIPQRPGDNALSSVNQVLSTALPTTGPATLPSQETTHPMTATTDPLTETFIHITPATTQAPVPVDPTPTTRPVVVAEEKPEIKPSLIRPTTPMNKGPHILEGPRETPP